MRQLLFKCQDMDAPTCVPVSRGEVWVYTHACPTRPGSSQDVVGVFEIEDCGLVLALADGMGGTVAGDAAARIAVESLGEALAKGTGEGANEQALRTAVLDGIEAGNRNIVAMGVGAGCTLVTAVIAERSARFLHAGDSEGVLIDQRGGLLHATVPHSPVGYGVAAGLIDPDEALRHPARHLVNNHLGSTGLHVELSSPIAIPVLGTLLLATDGLFDNLPPNAAGPLVAGSSLEEGTAALRAEAEAGMRGEGPGPGKPDDLSFIAYRDSVGSA